MLEFVLQAAETCFFCDQAINGGGFGVEEKGDFLLPGERGTGDNIKTSSPNSLCILCIAFVSLLRYNISKGGNANA